MDIAKLYTLYLSQGQKITTDTRKIEKGQIFFALKGPQFDGNQFAHQAIENGARYAVVDDASLSEHPDFIYVKDVIQTLQQLALHHRRTLNLPVLAITGSNGKTTTKELIKDVLSRKFNVAYTRGNLNNHIGIPLTLLEIKAYEDIAVIEMGANHIGEIESYCQYVEPNYGIITNIGKAHLEGFGGIEGVIQGKTELYKYLSDHMGTLFINEDDQILKRHASPLRSVGYSIHCPSEYQGIPEASSSEGFLRLKIKEASFEHSLQTQLTGDYNAYNVLAAYAIGRYFEVLASDIQSAIEHYLPSNSRSQLIRMGTYRVIMDAYNANPSSMEEALNNLAKSDHRKIAILGAMKELGEESKKEHKYIIDLAMRLNIDVVAVVGEEYMPVLNPSSRIRYFSSTSDAKKWYQHQVWKDELILIKGSRGMALEKILERDS